VGIFSHFGVAKLLMGPWAESGQAHSVASSRGNWIKSVSQTFRHPKQAPAKKLVGIVKISCFLCLINLD
jgi:hypothetical protein